MAQGQASLRREFKSRSEKSAEFTNRLKEPMAVLMDTVNFAFKDLILCRAFWEEAS
jgi:hypothetical protein